MQPSLAPLEDFELRIPGGISAGDEARAQAALDDASALVRAEADLTWVTDGVLDDDIPDIIVSVTMAAAKRAYINPDGVRSESVDNYSTTFATSSPDVYLTATEKKLIRRVTGRGGVWALSTTRGPIADVASTSLDVLPTGEPITYGEPDPA